MPAPTTEKLHDRARELDLLPLDQAARILMEGQIAATAAVVPTAAALAEGGRAMADSVRAGHRLWYIGAGSSGLMAAADALELGGTFGIAPDRVRVVMAGGMPTNSAMPGDTEDDISDLGRSLADLAPGDTAIAVAASGRTPFTVAAAAQARARGALVVALANNPGAALFDHADVAVLLATPPEVISGSTRLGAATAQKIALNTMSTVMGIALGQIYDGMMVGVVADNEKLRGRAAGIVRAVTGSDDATGALAAAGGDVKTAVLLAAGAVTADAARALLDQTQGHLRPALDRLRAQRTS